MAELQGQKDEKQKFILSPDQQKALEAFRKDIAENQRDLRDVRKKLREGIEQLGVAVKALNIVGVPVLVSLAGIGFWLYRRSRTRR